MLRRWLDQYERFLRIDPDGPTGVVVRARAIYAFGWSFVIVQTANIFVMTQTYGPWSRYHLISAAVCVAIVTSIIALRFTKAFTGYAIFHLVLMLSGVYLSAGPSEAGINSSLMPFIILAPLICGFVSGPRLTLLAGVISAALIWMLYGISVRNPDPMWDVYDAKMLERACQATYALIMGTVVGCAFSASIFHAFEKLEGARRRAERAEDAKARFLATMSHELRTPLNGVLGLTQSLQTTGLNDEQSHLVRTIGSSGDALLAILNDIGAMPRRDFRLVLV
ncbi:MAG: histidine kinase dimerization/phospho-acceptor domain-containing protein [Pseudomonadota bacterium]